jgi:ABC-type transport system involved in cytochrome c biogenesis permease subunit
VDRLFDRYFDLWRREIMRAHGGDEAAKAPLANVKIHPAVDQWSQIFAAYAQADPKAFNRDVAAYRNELGAAPPQEYGATRIGAESAFNRAEPFFYTAIVYFFCFLCSLIGMFGALPSLRSLHVFQTSATWLLAFSLLVHTVAIIARVYISQYAPVTNLYSSAVFIGWACVALALVLESIFRIGLANMVGSAAGFLTLLVAHYLSLDGDTIGVMQAVLDTQFWLSTHVVTVSLGYATTLLAGLLGIAYILYGVCTPGLDRGLSKTLAGMIYSVICFAMFFSFIGTVLGGLWADDSWGRFWGWDPKENGALIIVLWNALVLHARWGKMVGDRGLAILAILGNICTCWSWFGVNELGVGLHSYGFTEGVLKWLGIAAVSHLLVAGIGLMPQYLWLSGRALLNEEPTPTATA